MKVMDMRAWIDEYAFLGCLGIERLKGLVQRIHEGAHDAILGWTCILGVRVWL